jgi:hypothetical protein
MNNKNHDFRTKKRMQTVNHRLFESLTYIYYSKFTINQKINIKADPQYYNLEFILVK